ncbi:unnamed protein product [Echinostoma caproni]|uniref:EF-hand domain-containing protein n=1 Tax=Echinostoma caproni TaxID=27848 RepID=A0A183BG69_9TREM|nr:unnamed protein product [Echinostoma caproni]
MRKLARFRKVRTSQSTEFNNRDAKLRFLFGMYDLDMDNMISRNELLGMLQMMVGANITIEQVCLFSKAYRMNHTITLCTG